MWVQRRGTSDWCMSSDPLSCAQHLPSPRIYLQINEGLGGKKKYFSLNNPTVIEGAFDNDVDSYKLVTNNENNDQATF